MGVNALEVRRRVILAQPHEAVASGAVASFRTDVVSALPMEFDLLPIQDLHGQANPYPPGGGKNLLNCTLESGSQSRLTWTISSDKKIALSGTPSALIEKNVGSINLTQGVQYALSGCNSGTNAFRLQLKRNGAAVVQQYNGADVAYTATETGEYVVSFVVTSGTATGETLEPMVRLASTPSGFAPYSNLCPITGHDGFTRTGTGKNLLPSSLPADVINATINSSNKITSATYARTFGIKCKKNTNYYISSKTSGTALSVSLGTKKPAIGDSVTGKINMVNRTTYKMSTGDNDWLILTISSVSEYSGIVTKEFMIEESSTKTAYEAYSGHSYETTFPTPPGTVYGCHIKDNGDGTYDLTVTRAYIGGSDWEQYNSSPGFKAYRIQNVPVSFASVLSAEPMSNVISEYGNFNSGSMTKNIIQLPSNVYEIYMALQEDFDASDVYVTYLMKEPVTYTNLPLTALQSLIGQNHIWVDNADSVTVEYWGH